MIKNSVKCTLHQQLVINNVSRMDLISEIYKINFENLYESLFRSKPSNISSELLAMEPILTMPFPFLDTKKIKKDFKALFNEGDILEADLNSYWMNIAGSYSYLMRGKFLEIPSQHIERLKFSFFDKFEKYKFFSLSIGNYPSFYMQYMTNEKARMLILYSIFLEH
jgi:hypothetical protein